ncbi:hypothetical protein GCM10009841_30390 [Microlunatus panaciterrae]|uniref:Uncharacterized protein with FMN-binding domain n=1 Tax=Microlunatus panaciterrae TaxID=400768 RepID=A0ABS2RFC2_9ACTN|nr:FMN-binding protein [Microlunatus panaciterrae]MBM7797699.1 uncharacterized protein with FMN-binding domain [Microlunatus panaciterrae]
MRDRRLQGALVYLAVLGASGAVFGLKTYAPSTVATEQPPAATAPAPGGASTAEPSTGSTGKGRHSLRPRHARAVVSTVTGAVSPTPYGPVQVSVTFRGARITDVRVLQTPDRDGHSRSIADRAVPTLHDAVIASQSARIDTVSGATYTSQGYARSVQSAIDQHGR